jgi:hypothetical protein
MVTVMVARFVWASGPVRSAQARREPHQGGCPAGRSLSGIGLRSPGCQVFAYGVGGDGAVGSSGTTWSRRPDR